MSVSGCVGGGCIRDVTKTFEEVKVKPIFLSTLFFVSESRSSSSSDIRLMASEVGLFLLTGQFFLCLQCQLDLIIAYQIQIMSAIDQAIYLELLWPQSAFWDHRGDKQIQISR